MKKQLSVLLFALLAVLGASAHSFAVNGIYYRITNSTQYTVGVTYRGDSYSEYSNEYTGSVTIPSTVYYNGRTYRVTSIELDAFRDCSSMTYIRIPASIEHIYRPFIGCTSLQTVYLDDSSTATTSFHASTYTIDHTYEDDSYEEYYKITTIPIFNDCNIKNIYIGHTVKSYVYGLFLDAPDYGDISYYVKEISGGLFSSEQTVNRLEFGTMIPENGGLDADGFKGKINNLYISSIEHWCSMYNSEDKSYYDDDGYNYRIVGPKTNLMSKSQNLYVGGTLTSFIDIPNSVTSLGYSTFEGAKCIKGVSLPVYLASIGERCFYGCNNLKTVINNSALNIKKGEYQNGYVAYYANYVVDSGVFDNDYVFIKDNGAYSLIGYVGYDTDLTLPASVKGVGYNIANSAFQNCTYLTSIRIPDGVTGIGNQAFSGCTNLTSVTIGNSVTSIGNSVTSIGNSAFSGCSGLTEVTIGNSVTSIGGNAFNGCRNLISATIGNSVTSIGNYAFYDCLSLTTATIGNSVTSIGSSAFYNCSGLTSITIPESVTSIGTYAFSKCSELTTFYGKYASEDNRSLILDGALIAFAPSGLTEYTIPNSVTSIGNGTFSYCSGLTEVTIPNSVTSIGNYAFQYCSGLTEVTIPNSVTSIGNYAFQYCSGLTEVTIGNSVTSIGNYAFQYCSGLTEVTIPNSVTSIGYWAFSGCSSLTSITCLVEDPSQITMESSVFYNVPTSTCTLYVPVGSKALYQAANQWKAFANIEELIPSPDSYLTFEYTDGSHTAWKVTGYTSDMPAEVEIPAEHEGLPVTAIVESAFSGCSRLTSVTIPESITSIGNSAFANCSKLTTVNFNAENCKSMGSSFYPVFENCTSLSTINIGDNVKSIPDYAFCFCSGLTSVTIPNSVTSIGDYAFRDCSGLTSVTIPNSVTSIGDYAFYFCSGLTEVTIPNSVTSIGDHAFYFCRNLTSVTIGNSVTSIGEAAFSSCSSLTAFYGKYASEDNRSLIVDGALIAFAPKGLTEYTIPNSVTSIGDKAFSGCSGLTSVTIPNSVTSIGNSAFASCRGLTSVTIPNSVTAIGKSAFSDCTDLTSVTIGNSVTSIGEMAFSDCSSLTSVTIGNSVTSIGYFAFFGCSGLTSVTCLVEDPSQITMGSGIFGNVPTSTCTLYVPSGSKALYQAANQWMEFANIEELSGFTPGDVNGDGRFTAVDVAMVVSYALEGDPAGGSREAADANGDGLVTALDVAIVVSYVLSDNQSSAPRRSMGGTVDLRSADANEVTIERSDLSVNAGGNLELSITGMAAYTAAQFDIELPEGVTVKDIRLLGSDGTGHSVAFTQADGTARVLAYSPRNRNFGGNATFEIELQGGQASRLHNRQGNVSSQAGSLPSLSVDGIRLVEIAGSNITEAAATGCAGNFDLSGLLSGLNRGMDIKVTADGVVITASEECDITVADTLGRVWSHHIHPGTNSLTLTQGVYFINNKKIIVK